MQYLVPLQELGTCKLWFPNGHPLQHFSIDSNMVFWCIKKPQPLVHWFHWLHCHRGGYILTLAASPRLDRDHAAFGRLCKGGLRIDGKMMEMLDWLNQFDS